MGSDEERLEELLRSVMDDGDKQEEAAVPEELPVMEEAVMPEELPVIEEAVIPEEPATSEEISLEELSVPEEVPVDGSLEKEVDPLAFMDMSEEEVDEVLGNHAGQDMADIQELLDMSENHETVSEDGGEAVQPDNVDWDNMDNISELLEGIVSEAAEDEQSEPTVKKEKKKKEKKPKREKKPKKEKKKAEGTEEKGEKESFGKRLTLALFGSDEDELTDNATSADAGTASDAEEKNGAVEGKAKPEKSKVAKKKEKKEKKAKKNEPNPKKDAKERLKKEKAAEKARMKAEKAAKAAEEKRTEKKLPKKKVIVWILLCGSIAAGILLINSVGMDMVNIAEARNAFYDQDYQTAYRLFNGRELDEEDRLSYEQSSVVLHLKHVNEAYANRLRIGKPVKALEGLIQGVGEYQELSGKGRSDLLIPEVQAEYQKVLDALQSNYGLSEEGALEILNIEDDYEYSLQLEALVNGEGYQSAEEETETETEEVSPESEELEDLLPEEEEYLNGSSD